MKTTNNEAATTLIVGGAGKTGRRVADRLAARGRSVRLASRSSGVPFDWDDETTWATALQGASSLYLTYYPDLSVPGAAENVDRLSRLAVDRGVGRIVLLAGRGEPQVRPAEDAVRACGATYTILECAFFNQNFTEGWVPPVDGVIAFPAGDTAEPFVDCDDIADVVVAALTEDVHQGETYDVTGPRLLDFHEVARTLADVSGQAIRYEPVSGAQYAAMLEPHLPADQARFFVDLFGYLLDGHNAHVGDGVERALGRPARDFRDFARDAARTDALRAGAVA